MSVRNILDANSNIIGTLELPDNTTEDVWTQELSLYIYLPLFLSFSSQNTLSVGDFLSIDLGGTLTKVINTTLPLKHMNLSIDSIVLLTPIVFQVQVQNPDLSWSDIAGANITIPIGASSATNFLTQFIQIAANTAIRVYYQSGDIPINPVLYLCFC